jgi:hypothetical protein
MKECYNMKLDEAKKLQAKLNKYITLVESYNADTYEKFIKEYAIQGNINKVAKVRNDKNYRIRKRKIDSKDIL